MPTSHASLGAAIQSAAATQTDLWAQIKAGLAALWAYIASKGRTFFDEPSEQKAIAAEAVAAFNKFIGDKLGPGFELVVDAMISEAITRELAWLSATPTIPPVTPPAPPTGSAPQGAHP